MLTYIITFCYTIIVNQIKLTAPLGGEQEEKMIIELVTKSSMVAYTPKQVYNAWKRGNTLQLYVLSSDKITDVLYHFSARIVDGEIHLVIDDVALVLYSHDELVNTIRCAFPEDWHDVITIIETLLYV